VERSRRLSSAFEESVGVESQESSTAAQLGMERPEFDATRHAVLTPGCDAQTPFTFPWQIYTYDPRSDTTRMVAEAPDVGVDPVPAGPDGTQPVILRDRVHYSAVKEIVDGTVVPAVYSVPADGSEPAPVEQKGAFFPQVSGERLVTVRADPGTFRNRSITSRRLPDVSGPIRIGHGGAASRMSGAASSGGTTTWQEAVRGRCRTFVSAPDGRRSLGTGNGETEATYFPRMSSGFASFGRAAGRPGHEGFLWRLRDSRLSRFTDDRLTESPYIAGRYVVWQPVSKPGSGRAALLVGRLGGRALR
jgi:hypothetical protein